MQGNGSQARVSAPGGQQHETGQALRDYRPIRSLGAVPCSNRSRRGRLETLLLGLLGLLALLGFWFVSSLVFIVSPRLLSAPFLLASYVLLFLFLRRKRPRLRWLLLTWALFLGLSLSPIDISLHDYPGPPRLVPWVIGLPTEEMWEQAERHEIVLGGCLMGGNPPKYILLW